MGQIKLFQNDSYSMEPYVKKRNQEISTQNVNINVQRNSCHKITLDGFNMPLKSINKSIIFYEYWLDSHLWIDYISFANAFVL